VEKKATGKRAPKKTLRRIDFTTRLQNGVQAVVMTGDFTSWSAEGLSLENRGDGLWGTVLELPPGEYQYRLRVDGDWQDHAEATGRIPNGFGTQNCVLKVE
jgi:hypothetical protein